MTRAVSCGLVLAAVGCAGRLPPTPPRPPAGRGLTVTLRWSAPIDLDLYVTDPSLETVYFANPRTRSGGVLERDARCADRAPGEQAEVARWTAPPTGGYRVGVDFIETCRGRSAEGVYRLTVDVDGQRREIEGRGRRGEREPAVLEFTVPAEGPP